ncbi:hypothetical protein SASPL_141430 [Salvia splendens]|uniref:P-type ATPase N-terminal domain-containing protein n=1 Tax=Salvia splendens TaxID=180675 RepID=A0A8X8ZDF0_SALSN|nr:hypothetical protein SASPL_141430 [Salvia splendens]
MGGERRKKLHLSQIYSFKCGIGGFKDEHSQIGRPGFSRVVFCNEPYGADNSIRSYATNYVKTTKYTASSFLPKSLFEQFRITAGIAQFAAGGTKSDEEEMRETARGNVVLGLVANFYCLVTGCLSFTPLALYTASSAILPLIVVIGATMVKEGIGDFQRKKQVNFILPPTFHVVDDLIDVHSFLCYDIEINNRKVKVHQGGGIFKQTEWRNLRVGDLVKVEKDQFFPADLVLLSSSYEEAIWYVEMMNLDGETNLKLKQALEVTSSFFIGSMEVEDQQYALSPLQLLLRDSKLRNTDHIYGAVIITGHDTKVIQNSTDPPSKRSKKMDMIIYLLFGVLFLLAQFTLALLLGMTRKVGTEGAVFLYSYFIPISLYVSIEIVKVLQSVDVNCLVEAIEIKLELKHLEL